MPLFILDYKISTQISIRITISAHADTAVSNVACSKFLNLLIFFFIVLIYGIKSKKAKEINFIFRPFISNYFFSSNILP
jgi:hypothetical protein